MAPNQSDDDNSPPPRASFRGLPSELRNRIYFMSGCLDRRMDCGLIKEGRVRAVTGDRLPNCSKLPPRFPSHMAHCQYAEEKFEKMPRAFLVVSTIEETKALHSWRRYLFRSCQCILPAQSNRETLRLPALTQVSRHVRNETLAIFLGNHPVVFLLIGENTNEEEKEIMDWLDIIGPVAAGFLRDIEVVYSSKQMVRHIDGEFSEKLRQRGVKVDEGVLSARRMKYPFMASKAFALRQLELRE